MSRCVRVPLYVIESKISPSAKLLWVELALVSSPKKPQVFIDLKALAEKIGRSKATVSRLIREIEKAGLIIHTGVVNRCHKTYNLVWIKSEIKIKSPVILAPTLSQIPKELHPEVIRIFKATPIEAEFHVKLMALLKNYWEMEQTRARSYDTLV
ncbi:MAG: helix-turn-helix domain-containing protein [Myxococcaceae bacterium]